MEGGNRTGHGREVTVFQKHDAHEGWRCTFTLPSTSLSLIRTNLNPANHDPTNRKSTSSSQRKTSKTPTTPTSGPTSPQPWNARARTSTPPPSSRRSSENSKPPARPTSTLPLPQAPPLRPARPTEPKTTPSRKRRRSEMAPTSLRRFSPLQSRPHSKGKGFQSWCITEETCMHDHIFESRIPFLALHDFSFFFFFVGCMHAMDGRNEGCLFLFLFTPYTLHSALDAPSNTGM